MKAKKDVVKVLLWLVGSVRRKMVIADVTEQVSLRSRK